MNLKVLALSFAVTTALAGCANQFDISEEAKSGALRPDAVAAMQAARGTTYVREIRTADALMQKQIFLTSRDLSLREVLQEALPGYSIIPRGKVMLNEPVDISARGMVLGDFIDYIEGQRDLDITVEDRRVIVNDFETREWNLAAFASTRSVNNMVASSQTAGAAAASGGSRGAASATGTSVGYTLSEDEWAKIMAGAKVILGIQGSAAEEPPSNSGNGGADSSVVAAADMGGSGGESGAQEGQLNFDVPSGLGDIEEGMTPPYVEGIRSVGIVTAGGNPSRVKVLDRYLKRALSEATKIVNVQVQAYDVVLENSKDKGVDWDALISGTLNGNPFGLQLNSAASATTDAANSMWSVEGNYTSDHLNVKSLLLTFLEKYGRVELQDQPNITVRNGVPAQIYAGQELSYIVDVEQAQDVKGNVTVTPSLGRLKVGVTLSVTVRVLENDQLLVDIWPVISNLGKFDTIAIGDYAFETPRVDLKEFSTQLITSSGRPVHLGGLITKKMGEALETLPWDGLVAKKIMSPLMEDIHNAVDRRELVLVVTPTLVEGIL